MAKEIRATGLSQKTCDRWEEISSLVGGTTNAATMATVIDLIYLLYCSSRWVDIQRKAATLVTAQWADRSKSVVPMASSEVLKVILDGNGAMVYTRGQGEPYRIKRETWEQG